MRAMPGIWEEHELHGESLLLKDERIHGRDHDIVMTVHHKSAVRDVLQRAVALAGHLPHAFSAASWAAATCGDAGGSRSTCRAAMRASHASPAAWLVAVDEKNSSSIRSAAVLFGR